MDEFSSLRVAFLYCFVIHYVQEKHISTRAHKAANTGPQDRTQIHKKGK